MNLYKMYKQRIPRKLKKAAKYGIIHSINQRTINADGIYK